MDETTSRQGGLLAAAGSIGILGLVLVVGNAGLSNEPNADPSGWWWLPIALSVGVVGVSARVLVSSGRGARMAQLALALLLVSAAAASVFVLFYSTSGSIDD